MGLEQLTLGSEQEVFASGVGLSLRVFSFGVVWFLCFPDHHLWFGELVGRYAFIYYLSI